MPNHEHSKFEAWLHRIYTVIFLLYAPVFIAEHLGHTLSSLLPAAACVNWFPWTLALAVISTLVSGCHFYRRPPASLREWAWLFGLPVLLALLAVWAGFRPESNPPLSWSRLELRDADGKPRSLEPELLPFDAVIHGYIRTEQLLKAGDNKKLVARRLEKGYELPPRKKGEDGRLIGENYISGSSPVSVGSFL